MNPRRGRHSYNVVDDATQIYLAVVGMLILLFHGDAVPSWAWLAGGHVIAMALIHSLIGLGAARREGTLLGWLRHFYPLLLYLALYRETAVLNQMFYSGYLDGDFMRWEERLFGMQPSLVLMQRWPYVWLSEILYGAYFSYYLMIAGVAVILYARHRAAFSQYMTVISLIFYLCYLGYILLPVVGPRAFFETGLAPFGEPGWPIVSPPVFPEAIRAGPFFGIMEILYRHFEGPGAAFPSSHVAAALGTVYFSFRFLPQIRWVHAVLVVLLCVATVYCRYHYVLDVVAGVVTATILIPMGNRLHQRFTEAGDGEA